MSHSLSIHHSLFTPFRALILVQTPSNRVVEITTVASSYHIEMNPGDAGIYDRYIVQDVIKEIKAKTSLF